MTLVLSGGRGTVTTNFEIVFDERFYGPLLAAATQQVFDKTWDQISGGTSEVAWEITFETGDRLTVLEQTSDPDDLAVATAKLAAEPLLILGRNPFEVPDLKHISISVRYEEARRVAEIVHVKAETPTVEPGEAVVAFVRLQPFREEARVEEVRITLPEELKGEVELTFRAGEDREDDEDNEGEPEELSCGELLVAMRNNVQASELVVEVEIGDEPLRLERIPFPFLLEGRETLRIEVQEVDINGEEELPMGGRGNE